MTVQHNVITDPDLHEPKGVASAASGKVYKSDGTGSGTLTFEPPLRSAISAQDITYDNVPFTVRLRNDIQEFSIGTTNLYQYELDVIESL